jgi:hypothetical protein
MLVAVWQLAARRGVREASNGSMKVGLVREATPGGGGGNGRTRTEQFIRMTEPEDLLQEFGAEPIPLDAETVEPAFAPPQFARYGGHRRSRRKPVANGGRLCHRRALIVSEQLRSQLVQLGSGVCRVAHPLFQRSGRGDPENLIEWYPLVHEFACGQARQNGQLSGAKPYPQAHRRHGPVNPLRRRVVASNQQPPAAPDHRFGTEDLPMKPHLNAITLAVDDLERALHFYRDGLGLPTNGIFGTEFPGSAAEAAGAIAMFTLANGLILSVYPLLGAALIDHNGDPDGQRRWT